MAIKGVVDESVTIKFKNSQDDPIDETHEFTVRPLVAPPPPYWLIIPIGIALIYLVIRK